MTKQNSNSVALKPKIATFAMKGMTCIIGCAKTIQEKLVSIEGVQKQRSILRRNWKQYNLVGQNPH